MFNKKCPKCSRKISRDYEFCPYCGLDFRPDRRQKNQEDFGLLGKEDDLLPSMPMPNFNAGMPFGFNNLFNSLLKEVDKQFRELDKEMSQEKESFKKQEKTKRMPNSSGISISISTTTGKKPEIRVNAFGPEFQNLNLEPAKEMRIKQEISEEQAKKMSKLPRREADAKVRRLSNKIIYEIELPGVKSLKEIIINKLENSTEIKAFPKDKVYFKLLPINLPITNYKLENEKLILEFKPQ